MWAKLGLPPFIQHLSFPNVLMADLLDCITLYKRCLIFSSGHWVKALVGYCDSLIW